MKNQLSVEMYIEAFKNKYNYDAIDELDFESESFVDKINESIMDYEDDDENPDKDTLAEIVYDILYSKQYGDTSDENDLEEIREDIESRFPEG